MFKHKVLFVSSITEVSKRICDNSLAILEPYLFLIKKHNTYRTEHEHAYFNYVNDAADLLGRRLIITGASQNYIIQTCYIHIYNR